MIRAPRFGGLNHDPRAGLNGPFQSAAIYVEDVAFWGEADITIVAQNYQSVLIDP